MRLIIVPNKIAKSVVKAFITENDIVLTVDEIIKRKYKKYPITEISFHQYPLVEERFREKGYDIKEVQAKLLKWLKERE